MRNVPKIMDTITTIILLLLNPHLSENWPKSRDSCLSDVFKIAHEIEPTWIIEKLL